MIKRAAGVVDGEPTWENRAHFYFAAVRAVRDIVVEQARRYASAKHREVA